jgi:hypothetical protein
VVSLASVPLPPLSSGCARKQGRAGRRGGGRAGDRDGVAGEGPAGEVRPAAQEPLRGGPAQMARRRLRRQEPAPPVPHGRRPRHAPPERPQAPIHPGTYRARAPTAAAASLLRLILLMEPLLLALGKEPGRPHLCFSISLHWTRVLDDEQLL